MHSDYGSDLLLGVLIGGAILLHDVITREHHGPPPHMTIVHHREDSIDPSALGAGNDHNVRFIKTDDGPAGDLAAAVGAVIDLARADGRQPSHEEVEAAVSTIAGDAKSIDVEVLPSSQ